MAKETVRALRRAARHNPRWLLAPKTAVAAGLAWLLVQPLGGFVDDYPYYAPLGAVVAMSTTVVSSVRSSVQAVVAILLGAVIAFASGALLLPEPLALVVAIAVGTFVAGWQRLGSMSGWVPFVALFVLIVGGDDPIDYAAAYGGLTALGAAIGVGVNALFPQLPLERAAIAQDQLRRDLANQLDLLAEGLEAEQALDRVDWERLRLALRPQARRVEALVAEALEARRGNWKARRWTEVVDRRYQQALALQRLTSCVDEVLDLVVDERVVVHAADDRAAELRVATGHALRAVAAMFRSVDEAPGDEEAGAAVARHADSAVRELRDRAARAVCDAGERYLAAAAIAVSLDKAVDAWA